MPMEHVSTRNICDPDTAGLANNLLDAITALQTQVDAIPLWFAGHGTAADTIGRDGDFYIDRDTGNVYVKEGGTWDS
jgi:hypothetical protein